jgi:hypothetical protein
MTMHYSKKDLEILEQARKEREAKEAAAKK